MDDRTADRPTLSITRSPSALAWNATIPSGALSAVRGRGGRGGPLPPASALVSSALPLDPILGYRPLEDGALGGGGTVSRRIWDDGAELRDYRRDG